MSRELFKYLQDTGFGSRRAIRLLISQGKCEVNGQRVKDPKYPVVPQKDRIRINGKPLKQGPQKKAYYLLNKPVGAITTLHDPEGRPTILDFISAIPERVYPVGRLDYTSEGLVLLTNDGLLTQFIISARNRIPKFYQVTIKGHLAREELTRLRATGVMVSGRRVKPLVLRPLTSSRNVSNHLEIAVTEGRKHLVRIFFSRIGHPVNKLKRTAIGTFRLTGIPTGHWREVTREELRTFAATYKYGKFSDRINPD